MTDPEPVCVGTSNAGSKAATQVKSKAEALTIQVFESRACLICNRRESESDGVSIYSCINCKLARYCSTVCQQLDWHAGHKERCRKFAEDLQQTSLRRLPRSQQDKV